MSKIRPTGDPPRFAWWRRNLFDRQQHDRSYDDAEAAALHERGWPVCGCLPRSRPAYEPGWIPQCDRCGKPLKRYRANGFSLPLYRLREEQEKARQQTATLPRQNGSDPLWATTKYADPIRLLEWLRGTRTSSGESLYQRAVAADDRWQHRAWEWARGRERVGLRTVDELCVTLGLHISDVPAWIDPQAQEITDAREQVDGEQVVLDFAEFMAEEPAAFTERRAA